MTDVGDEDVCVVWGKFFFTLGRGLQTVTPSDRSTPHLVSSHTLKALFPVLGMVVVLVRMGRTVCGGEHLLHLWGPEGDGWNSVVVPLILLSSVALLGTFTVLDFTSYHPFFLLSSPCLCHPTTTLYLPTLSLAAPPTTYHCTVPPIPLPNPLQPYLPSPAYRLTSATLVCTSTLLTPV
ncbi:hypothetical protein Pcinc_042246 [Petrolisthes cinctipes]|uniref:Uncharacterized protein n=1 Tax=Petrolisthes cinctipes TaxID=88211 RepID=A0AAE1BLM9_PETCI|nr:hypothetical protein Pcinc_042246 [Petrolisthes cinctipes]